MKLKSKKKRWMYLLTILVVCILPVYANAAEKELIEFTYVGINRNLNASEKYYALNESNTPKFEKQTNGDYLLTIYQEDTYVGYKIPDGLKASITSTYPLDNPNIEALVNGTYIKFSHAPNVNPKGDNNIQYTLVLEKGKEVIDNIFIDVVVKRHSGLKYKVDGFNTDLSNHFMRELNEDRVQNGLKPLIMDRSTERKAEQAAERISKEYSNGDRKYPGIAFEEKEETLKSNVLGYYGEQVTNYGIISNLKDDYCLLTTRDDITKFGVATYSFHFSTAIVILYD